MQLFHFWHFHYNLRSIIETDFWLFELSVWLHATARSMITIFIPILLLQNGFSLQAIVLYYLLYYLFDTPLNFLTGALIRRFGARWVIVLANLFIISYFLLFNIMESGNLVMLVGLALFGALYDSLYWVAHLYLFIKSSHSDKTAEDTGGKTGTLYSVKRIATMTGPILGAGILTLGTQTLLFGAGIVLFFLSIIPLLYMNQLTDKPEARDHFASLRDFFRNPVEKNNFLSVGLYSVHQLSELILWPLFIFLIFETINSVAVIPILIAGTTVIFSSFNKRISSSSREYMIAAGAVCLALLWISRLAIDWEPFYYISIILAGVFSLFLIIPLDSNLFLRATATDPLKTVVLRNTVTMGTRAAVMLLLLILMNVFHTAFVLTIAALLLLTVVNIYFLTTDWEDFDAIVG